MKQYTTPEQTAKLIELGFEPSTRIPFEVGNDELGRTFSIGELMEMLPKEIGCSSLQLYHAGLWTVSYPLYESKYYVASYELCDALFEMICYLKEEGVI